MRKIVLAASALVAGVLSSVGVAAQPAGAAPSPSCIWYHTNTGGGLNGKTSLSVCRIGNYIGELRGRHYNNGDNSHKGHIRIADNHNQAYDSPTVTVIPGAEYKTPNWHINQDWQSGHRVCSVWIKSSGTYTDGYACWTK